MAGHVMPSAELTPSMAVVRLLKEPVGNPSKLAAPASSVATTKHSGFAATDAAVYAPPDIVLTEIWSYVSTLPWLHPTSSN